MLRSFSSSQYLFVVTLTTTLLSLAGCQSAPSVETPTKPAPTPSPTQQRPTQTVSPVVDSKVVDDLFEKKNCATINELVKKAGEGAPVEPASPLSTMFIKFCASEADPKNTTKLGDAIAALNELETRYAKSHVVSAARLAELRALRYLAADEKDNALKNFNSSRELLLASPEQARVLDAQILDLNAAANALSVQERTQLRELMQMIVKDDRLFEGLKVADGMLAETKSKDARNIIYDERNRILARIELLFAMDMSLLEGYKNRGQDPEARELAINMKKKFPHKNYEMRIDSIVATAPMTPGAPVGTPSVASTILDDNLSDPQKIERALTEARAALDAGQAPKAVEVIDALPATLQTDKTKRLRMEAMEVHVRDLRAHVRALYTRAQAQPNKISKVETLKQAKQTLESILTKYPTTSVKVAVERNLKSVNDEITELGKSK